MTPRFGVNLFAPNPVPVDPDEFRRYAASLAPVAGEFGIDLTKSAPVEDDDGWRAKIDLLLADPVPVVSFTFGIPSRADIDALRRAGTWTIQTVTSVPEAVAAAEAGVDALAVQAAGAGGHSATLAPGELRTEVALPELVAGVRRRTGLEVIAAGGIAGPSDVADALRAGAAAVMVGTLLLRAAESGASEVHKAAIVDPNREPTVITRAFTGRPARGLANEFTRRYSALAPSGYPAVHHLTIGLRRASAAAGNPEYVNLWAGTGYRESTDELTAAILSRLAGT